MTTSSFNSPLLKAGQTVGIFSPSSSVVRERFDAGVALLNNRGLHVVIHPQTYLGADTGSQHCSSSKEKALAFMDLWENSKVDFIMASCGGNTASQFLHLLDYNHLEKSHKPVMGFSDTTSLLSTLYAQAAGRPVFGPTVQTLGRLTNQDDVFAVLSGDKTTVELGGAVAVTEPPQASGPIFAATLSVLLSLAGTPCMPNLAGHILLIEDIGEEVSRLDRLLWQLYQLVPFPLLAGLVFGDFKDLTDTGRPFGLDYDGLIAKYTGHLEIPVLKNVAFGHGDRLFPIPLGRKATLDATNKTLILQ